MWWFALGSTPLQGEITEKKYIIVGRFAAQNTDFITHPHGAEDVLWSRGVCFGLVEGGCANLYWSVGEHIGACCRESCPLLIVLRCGTPSSSICLSEVIRKPFALSRVFLLSGGGKSIVLVKKKAPSRSGFPLSMHVVLKTRHVNPNIHVRRFIVHVRSPNLSATRSQLLSLRGATTEYRSLHKAIRNQSKAIWLSSPSYIARPTHSYRLARRPI